MESKPKTSTAAIREKWTNYEEQTGMQYLIVAGGGLPRGVLSQWEIP